MLKVDVMFGGRKLIEKVLARIFVFLFTRITAKCLLSTFTIDKPPVKLSLLTPRLHPSRKKCFFLLEEFKDEFL